MFEKKNIQKILLDAPRAHHYGLGHVAFRMGCESNPLMFFDLVSDNKDVVKNMLWDRVCEQCGAEEEADFYIRDLQIEILRIRNYPAVLIIMPEAKAVGEAIMVLIVLTEKPNDLERIEMPCYRYFVLELGRDIEGNARTVFCEWSQQTHSNMGNGCEPDPKQFVALVAKTI